MVNIDKFNIKEGLLFKDTTGQKPVSAKWISRKFRKLLTLNGYDESFCRVHDLRGQFVDIMHYLGVTTEYIAREVGHSNVATTSKIYTQILNEVHKEANIIKWIISYLTIKKNKNIFSVSIFVGIL